MDQEPFWGAPTWTGQTNDAGHPLFSDADAPEYLGGQEQEEQRDLSSVQPGNTVAYRLPISKQRKQKSQGH